jgi:hypothetical protein
MRTPGFTAETSLTGTGTHYWSTKDAGSAGIAPRIVPQFYCLIDCFSTAMCHDIWPDGSDHPYQCKFMCCESCRGRPTRCWWDLRGINHIRRENPV